MVKEILYIFIQNQSFGQLLGITNKLFTLNTSNSGI